MEKTQKKKTWKQLGLENWLQNTCKKIGYKEPTDIQEKVIPCISKGKDVLSTKNIFF